MRLMLLAGILCYCLILSAQKVAVKPIETLYYSVSYNVIPITAGSITITVTPSDKYPKAQCIFAVGKSNNFVDAFFKVRDTLISYYNKETFLPYEFSRKAHEGNYHKTFDYSWSREKNAIYSDIHKIGRWKRRDTIPLKPETFDMLSMAWFVREVNFEDYNKNDLIPIRVLIDDKIYDLHVRYLGEETVKISREKRPCHVFSPLLVEGDVFKGGENMKIWVTKDEYRLPVILEAKIIVGAVKAVLDYSKSSYKD